MAIVIPDSALGDRAYGINAGEKYLLNKLKTALPDDCLIWHNIDLPNHYQPDIVAYLSRFGVIASQLAQVMNYYFELARLFQAKNVLLEERGYKGSFKLPIAFVAAFTRLWRANYPAEALERLECLQNTL